ncbi:hypothetical protein C8J56DRAFT_1043446 [Mycena floridula]|nr:hypothetical protein C8J56DRAFT_1043446 [Mycena floridula]
MDNNTISVVASWDPQTRSLTVNLPTGTVSLPIGMPTVRQMHDSAVQTESFEPKLSKPATELLNTTTTKPCEVSDESVTEEEDAEAYEISLQPLYAAGWRRDENGLWRKLGETRPHGLRNGVPFSPTLKRRWIRKDQGEPWSPSLKRHWDFSDEEESFTRNRSSPSKRPRSKKPASQ